MVYTARVNTASRHEQNISYEFTIASAVRQLVNTGVTSLMGMKKFPTIKYNSPAQKWGHQHDIKITNYTGLSNL
jgi:hypothetical protein